ncbi:hypothetical protein N7451_005695 [Penicillium sp. IBT 35674x]|nr:hypothetical protein N7451_005695 [Penicillium sp. IBT 35674x]
MPDSIPRPCGSFQRDPTELHEYTAASGIKAMLNRIPIPRLPNQHQGSKTHRTARACDGCRARKTKCDGNKPTCAQCASAGLENCVYSQSKQDRERQQLESAYREVDRYEELLREISQEVDVSVARKIMKALRPSPPEQEPRGELSSASSTSSTSSIGSLDALDTLDEDVNRSKASIATGYLGKSSEVAWMQSLALNARVHVVDEGVSKGSQNLRSAIDDSMASVDYHIESIDYPGLKDENPYALPARSLAERLLRLYIDSVQPSLPIIRQALFVDQFLSFYSGELIHPGRKWLAVLNLIFAISSKLCQMSGQDIQGNDSKFFSRAQKLIISESLVEDHEDLQQVQAETLAAFFLLTSSQINRAWKMIGTATRSAIALDLHLRATHNRLNTLALEARHRLWWSIFILENLLSVMTGRASGLGNSFCSAPPPLIEENVEYSHDDTPEARLKRPSENPFLKWTIYQQRERLEAQRRAGGKRIINPYHSRARQESAMTCLHSALAILSIFPDQPDPIWACHVLWWNVLHFLVQATTILLINISLENSTSKKQRGQSYTSGLDVGPLPGSLESANTEAVRTAAKKAFRWLYCLGETEASARRAFEICNECIRRIAPIGFDFNGFVSV